jgi:hypothetical protein
MTALDDSSIARRRTRKASGESKMANVGINLPGTGEVPVAPVYNDGKRP